MTGVSTASCLDERRGVGYREVLFGDTFFFFFFWNETISVAYLIQVQSEVSRRLLGYRFLPCHRCCGYLDNPCCRQWLTVWILLIPQCHDVYAFSWYDPNRGTHLLYTPILLFEGWTLHSEPRSIWRCSWPVDISWLYSIPHCSNSLNGLYYNYTPLSLWFY